MESLQISEDLLLEIEEDSTPFKGKLIDLADPPLSTIMHLDSLYARNLDVKRKEMAVQVIENRIRAAAEKKKIQVIALEFGGNKSKLKDIREKFCNGDYIVLIK